MTYSAQSRSGTANEQKGYSYYTPDLPITHVTDDKTQKNFGANNEIQSKAKLTNEDFAEAAFYFDSLVYNPIYPPDAAAQRYHEAYPHIDAYPLRYSERRQDYKAWAAFNKDTQRMFKFFGCVDRPCRYIITAKDLGLSKEFENSARFYEKAVNEAWKTAIEKLFNTKNRDNVIWFKLEVGESGRIHAHAIASFDAALPRLPRGTTKHHKVRLCETPENAISYLQKPALSYSAEHLAIWIQARRAYPRPKKLPRVSGFRNLPNSRTWGKL